MKLKFDYADYHKFLDDDDQSVNDWHGASIQLNESIIQDATKGYAVLTNLFNILIEQIASETTWYISHDDKLLPWFINKNESEQFPQILSILNAENLKYNDIGIITCSTLQLKLLASELIRYPSLLSYKNIDCMNSEADIILKITSHLTLDLISTSAEILQVYCNKANAIDGLLIKHYNVVN